MSDLARYRLFLREADEDGPHLRLWQLDVVGAGDGEDEGGDCDEDDGNGFDCIGDGFDGDAVDDDGDGDGGNGGDNGDVP